MFSKIDKRFAICSAIIFAICIIFYIYLLSNKTALHFDESYSLFAAVRNNTGVQKLLEEDKVYTGDEIREIVFGYSGSIKSALHDIFDMRISTNDSPHPNFYYSLLRLSLIGKDYTTFDNVLFRASFLNVLLAAASFVCFVLLCQKTLYTLHAKLLALIMAFFSPAALSNVLFFRPYELQMLFFIIAALLFWELIKRIQTEKAPSISQSIPTILCFAFLISLTLLTGYFALIFVATLALVSFITARRTAEPWLTYLIAMGLLVLLYMPFLYRKYFYGFISSRAQEAVFKTSSRTPIDNVQVSFNKLGNFLTIDFLCLSGIVLLVVLYIAFNRKAISRYWAGLLVASILFYVISMLLAPFKELRYVMPIFPIFALLIAKIFDNRSNIHLLSSIVVFILFLYTTFTSQIENYKNKLFTPPQQGNSVILTGDVEIWPLTELFPFINGNYIIKYSCDYNPEDADIKNADSIIYNTRLCPQFKKNKIFKNKNPKIGTGYYLYTNKSHLP